MRSGFLLGWKLDLHIFKLFVSFFKPTLWSCIIEIGAYFLWILQGGFFDVKSEIVMHDHQLTLLPRRFMCLTLDLEMTQEDTLNVEEKDTRRS